MELKPTEVDEFRTKQYWEQFFKKRGLEAFEWYGDYGELCDIIHKYAKLQDNILVVGCGNSQLSADMYDVGYTSLVNIDISDVVIRQMNEKYKDKQDMKFIKMDLMNMSFEDNEFTVVLDKGTLDAIMTSDDEKCHQDVDRIFAEIGRVLKFSGRYICITLAQEHIINKMVKHFTSIGWPVRVHKVETSRESELDRDFYMPVFVLVMTKFKTLPDANFKILEIAKEDGSVSRVENEEKIYSEVKGYQMFGLVRQRVVKRSLKEDQVCMTLTRSRGGDCPTPRYTVHVVDSQSKYKLKYACFIVPQGRENEWLFCTDDGRLQLAQSAQAQRLAVVSLHRDHHYTDIQTIQDELSSKILQLSPPGLGDTKVPFMSIGDNIGLRCIQSRGQSPEYGVWVVEDVTINGKVFRRLVYVNQPGHIQTEIRLVHTMRRKKGSKQLVPGKLVVDNGYLCVQRHVAMVAGLAFIHDFQKVLANQSEVLILGDPGCVLSSYLRKTHQQMKVDVLQSDVEFVQMAKSWFGLVEDKMLKCHVGVVGDVINAMVEKGVKKHVIICDMVSDCPDMKALMAPPSLLLEEELLTEIDSLLYPQVHCMMTSQESAAVSNAVSELLTHGFPRVPGIFMLHLRHAQLSGDTWRSLRKVFQVVLSKQLLDDISLVVYAVQSSRQPQLPHTDQQKLGESLKRSVQLLNTLTQKVHGSDVPSLVHMLENLRVH